MTSGRNTRRSAICVIAFPGVPLIALTAAADPHTAEDIVRVLHLAGAQRYVSTFDRPNIRYTVLEKRQPKDQLAGFLEARNGESGIVYALSRKRTEELAGWLQQSGHAAAAYHAGLPAPVRQQVQEDFIRDDLQGGGRHGGLRDGHRQAQRPLCRPLRSPQAHRGLPPETGRAGRDDLPSEAFLLFGAQDVVMARRLLESTENPDQRRIESHKLNAMVAFAESLICRRRVLLGYFGETLDTDCGNCDVCLNPPETFDATTEAQKALSCVYRVGQRFGARHVIDVLRGADTDRIRKLGHDGLSTYGIGDDLGAAEWDSIVRQLVHRGYLLQDIANYSVLKLTPKARPVLRGEESIELGRPRVRERAKRKKTPRSAVGLTESQMPLFEALRSLRKRLADEQGVPPYVVFGDATLVQMSQDRPATAEALLEITGVGQVKLERYGEVFLKAIAEGPGPGGAATS